MFKPPLSTILQHFKTAGFDAETLGVTPGEAEVLAQLFSNFCLEHHVDGSFLTNWLAEIRDLDTKYFSGDRLLEWMVKQGWETLDQTTSLKWGCTLTKGNVQVLVPFNPASPAYNHLLLEALETVAAIEGIKQTLLTQIINKRYPDQFEPLLKGKLEEYAAVVREKLKGWHLYDVLHNDGVSPNTDHIFDRQSGFGVTIKDAALVIYTNNGNRWAIPGGANTLIQTKDNSLLFVWKAVSESHFQTLFLQKHQHG